MDLLTQLFGHLCGRGRCFIVDGAALPICQRCLGLYVGAAVTAVWIVAGRLWRRGLPPRVVLAGHVLLLAGAILGGIHGVDSGPLWRLICGLATGHVLMVWLVAGASHLWRAGRASGRPPRRWRRVDAIVGLLAFALLAVVGVASAAVPALRRVGEVSGARAVVSGARPWAWGFWTIVSAAGAAALAVAVVCVVAAGVRFAWGASRGCKASAGPGR